MIRKPAVAGYFYESDEGSLKKRIKWCYTHKVGPGRLPGDFGNKRSIKGLIAPHAGYQYSGPVAAHSYLELAEDGMPEAVIILCPNHTGMGSGLSTMTEGSWLTPLGEVEIDSQLARQLVENYPLLDDDPSAHAREHSCEVQLPFLQFLYGDRFKVVPVCFLMQDYDSAVEVGRALVEALDARDVVVIASSDMTHYEPAKQAEKKDRLVLDEVENLNAKRFYETVESHNVTACGYAPITALMVYAQGVNAKAKLLNYRNSGDSSGDYSSVVGYASVCFRK
jgi:AmmeMemoRadiSam system protein B